MSSSDYEEPGKWRAMSSTARGPNDTVAILLDGLEADLVRNLDDGVETELQIAAVRAIRAALGLGT